ncbi:hypothetical protein [Bacillus proteolyticus]|uniref:hypothetical protein n=1 Tax=Bacillus proteolyticus TaxID=2026192 RepID=UPI0030F3AA0F
MGIKKIVLAGALGVAALAGTNLPGIEVTKASAASIESNISTIEGHVVEISNNVIFVESKQYTDPISINFDSIPNVKIGDQVKVTGTMMRNFTEYMIANSIENKSLTLGMHLKENGRPDYVIGEVSKKGKIDEYVNVPIDYVLVKYPKINGGDEILEVYLTQGQKLNVGDKVKVNNMEFAQWGGSSINWNIENSIEKIQESKTSNQNNDDQWIWS